LPRFVFALESGMPRLSSLCYVFSVLVSLIVCTGFTETPRNREYNETRAFSFEEGYICKITSSCIPCSKVELNSEYCSTGYRETYACIVREMAHTPGAWESSAISRYRPCTRRKTAEQREIVLFFEGGVLIVFVVALILVTFRKKAIKLAQYQQITSSQAL